MLFRSADDSDIRWQRELTRHRAPHWMFAPRTAVQERIQHPAHSANASANRQQIRRPRLGSRA